MSAPVTLTDAERELLDDVCEVTPWLLGETVLQIASARAKARRIARADRNPNGGA